MAYPLAVGGPVLCSPARAPDSGILAVAAADATLGRAAAPRPGTAPSPRRPRQDRQDDAGRQAAQGAQAKARDRGRRGPDVHGAGQTHRGGVHHGHGQRAA